MVLKKISIITLTFITIPSVSRECFFVVYVFIGNEGCHLPLLIYVINLIMIFLKEYYLELPTRRMYYRWSPKPLDQFHHLLVVKGSIIHNNDVSCVYIVFVSLWKMYTTSLFHLWLQFQSIDITVLLCVYVLRRLRKISMSTQGVVDTQCFVTLVCYINTEVINYYTQPQYLFTWYRKSRFC